MIFRDQLVSVDQLFANEKLQRELMHEEGGEILEPLELREVMEATDVAHYQRRKYKDASRTDD